MRAARSEAACQRDGAGRMPRGGRRARCGNRARLCAVSAGHVISGGALAARIRKLDRKRGLEHLCGDANQEPGTRTPNPEPRISNPNLLSQARFEVLQRPANPVLESALERLTGAEVAQQVGDREAAGLVDQSP